MMNRIVVPEGMERAAREAEYEYLIDNQSRGVCRHVILEAALRWQSENPPVPTDEQVAAIHVDYSTSDDDFLTVAKKNAMVEWVRRMYEAPEAEPDKIDLYRVFNEPGKKPRYVFIGSYAANQPIVINEPDPAEEAVKDLEFKSEDGFGLSDCSRINKAIKESYHRGEASK